MKLPKPICFLPFVAVAALAVEGSGTVRREIPATPKAVPAPVAPTTRHSVAEETAAAIQRLGPAATIRQISAVVYAAVHRTPDHAIEIVRAAVLASRAEAVEEIVAAAITAVPDPWKQVVYHRTGGPLRRGGGEFKGEPDFKSGEPDFKDGEGTSISLAEAIVLAALDARPGSNAASIYAAAESALRGSPGWLIAAINDPRGISGVGDAGNNNYANEPGRRKPPVLAPRPAPTPPIRVRVPSTPAPVSQ